MFFEDMEMKLGEIVLDEEYVIILKVFVNAFKVIMERNANIR